jgi:hypothetical protein
MVEESQVEHCKPMRKHHAAIMHVLRASEKVWAGKTFLKE